MTFGQWIEEMLKPIPTAREEEALIVLSRLNDLVCEDFDEGEYAEEADDLGKR